MSTNALTYQDENEEEITVTISKREHRLLKNLQPLFSDERFIQKLETLIQFLKMEELYIKEREKQRKDQVLDQLYGAWADDDSTLSVEEIYETRTISDRVIDFD